MSADITARIERMYRGDILFALSFIGILWLVMTFVFIRVSSMVGLNGVAVVLTIGAALVLLLNTAAIVAMVRHYAHEKEIIYGLDIRHLDAMTASRKS